MQVISISLSVIESQKYLYGGQVSVLENLVPDCPIYHRFQDQSAEPIIPPSLSTLPWPKLLLTFV